MAESVTPFSRLQLPDPQINRVVQDLYDKLAQAQSQISNLEKRVAKLEAK